MQAEVHRPRLSVLFPLVDDRGWMLPSLQSFTREQRLAAADFEVIVVGPRPIDPIFRELKQELRPGDRFLECDTQNEYRLFNLASKQASGDILFITESHVIAHANCLEIVAEHFAKETTQAARVTTLGQADSKLSELQKNVFEESFATGAEEGWNRVLIHGFAIRKDIYDSVQGFPETAENFGPWVLGRRLANLGVTIDVLEDACVDHFYMASLKALQTFITRFVRGDIDSRTQVWTEEERPNIPTNPQWERRALYANTYWEQLTRCRNLSFHEIVQRIYSCKVEPLHRRAQVWLRTLYLRFRTDSETFHAFWAAVIDRARVDYLVQQPLTGPVVRSGTTLSAEQLLNFPLFTPSYPVTPEEGGPLLWLAPSSQIELDLPIGRWDIVLENSEHRYSRDLKETRIFLEGAEIHHCVVGKTIRFTWTEHQGRTLTLSLHTKPIKHPKCPVFGLSLVGLRITPATPLKEAGQSRTRISVLVPLTEPRGKGRRCVESLLLDQRCPQEDFEVILLENGTQPELVTYAHSLLRPQDQILSFKTDNEFFMWSRAVEKSTAPYLFITEAHCHLDPDCLAQSIQYLDDHPDAHGLRCAVKDEFVNILGVLEEMFFERGRRDHPDGHWHEVSLRGMALRRSSLEALGGLEARFDHFADKVLSARLRAKGWSLPEIRKARIHHRNTSDFSEMEPHLRGFIEGEFEARARYGDALCNHWFDGNRIWEQRHLCAPEVHDALDRAGMASAKRDAGREAAKERTRNRLRRAGLRVLHKLRKPKLAFPLYRSHWRGVAEQVAWEALEDRPELCRPSGFVLLKGLHPAETLEDRRFQWSETEIQVLLPESDVDLLLIARPLEGGPQPNWKEVSCHLDGAPLRFQKIPEVKSRELFIPAHSRLAILSLQIPRYPAKKDTRKLGMPLEEFRIVDLSRNTVADLLIPQAPDPLQILEPAEPSGRPVPGPSETATSA